MVSCIECSEEFEIPRTRGKHSIKTCGPLCKKKRAKRMARASFQARKAISGKCLVNSCRGKATRKGGVCENHYFRMRRTGSYEGMVRSETAIHGQYVRMVGRGATNHPMASKKSKMLYQHRMVAYDSRKGQCDPCFWCGVKLD